METKLMTLTCNDRVSTIYCVLDMIIPEESIQKVIDANSDYFDLLRSGLIKATVLKFEQKRLKQSCLNCILRKIEWLGFEAATYKVLNNHKLFLDKETETSAELYRKNGLHVVEYDYMDGDEDEMIYRMLDDDELDPVGDGFTLEEAILFAENYALAHGWQ